MQNSVKKMLRRMFRDKKRQKRVVAVICALSVLVATGVFNQLMQPVITMTPDPICGVAEHAHISECYQKQLVCGTEESEEHAHGDGCYESVLACGKSEHSHVQSCYPEEIKEQPVITAEPTEVPATEAPTEAPATEAPTEPTEVPAEPAAVSEDELPEVTAEPETTEAPATEATAEPTEVPEVTAEPEVTEEPTAEPTEEPTAEPTAEPVAPAIAGVTASAETVTVGQTVTWTFEATSAAELTYIIEDSEGSSIASGALEAGATQISWLADRAGAFTLTITAANEVGSAAATAAVTVENAAGLTAAVRSDSASAFAGESVTFHFAVSGEPASVTITIDQDGETIGLLNEFAESLSIAPKHMGDKVTALTATITAASSDGAEVSDSVQIPVAVRIHETESDWIKATETELTDDWRENLLAVAETQLGYEESDLDFVIDAEGNAQGYTRYGQWWGASHDEWCAMFISFCLNYAEIPAQYFPREASCEKWIDELSYLGLYADDDYAPEAGDLIFFDWENDGVCDHVGIVTKAGSETISTIEGNSAASVRTREYDADDETIIGYGLMTKAFERYLADELDLDLETGVGAQARVTEEAILRAEPASDSMELAALTADTLVTVNAAEQNLDQVWYEVSVNETTGYLPAEVLELNYVQQEELQPVEPTAKDVLAEKIAGLTAPVAPAAPEAPAEDADEETLAAYAAAQAEYEAALAAYETAQAEYEAARAALADEIAAALAEAAITEEEAAALTAQLNGEQTAPEDVVLTAYEILSAEIAALTAPEAPAEDADAETLAAYETALADYESAKAALAEKVELAYANGELTDEEYAALTAMLVALEEPAVLISEGEDYTVTVSYRSDANIPAEATLSVREILPGTEEYDEYYASMMEVLYPEQVAAVAAFNVEHPEAAMAIAEGEADAEPAAAADDCCAPEIPVIPTPTFLRLFDICIMVDGAEIEPAAEVDVNIEFHSGIESPETDELSIIHFHEDEAPERVDGHREGGRVDFKADRFSTYGVATLAEGDPPDMGGNMGGSYSLDPNAYWLSNLKSSESADNYSGYRFYWRFANEEEDAATSNKYVNGTYSVNDTSAVDLGTANSLKDKVTVYYGGGYSDSSKIVPYSTYVDRASNYVKCSTVLDGATDYPTITDTNATADTSDDWDGSSTFYIVTAPNWVLTSYRICCEFGDGASNYQSGEHCNTDASVDLEVSIDASGLYRSVVPVTITEDNFQFGHTSNGMYTGSNQGGGGGNNSLTYATATGCSHYYVLFVEIKQVNTDIDVQKTADKDIVSVGEQITYTVTANVSADNSNGLYNVHFDDEFITGVTDATSSADEADDNIVDGSVKIIDTSGDENVVTVLSYSVFDPYTDSTKPSATADNDSTKPSKYYVENGVLYIDGLWKPEYTIEFQYTVTVAESDVEDDQVVNTVWVTATKYAEETEEAESVAQVKVLVNDEEKGSLRIIKTFEGLDLDTLTNSTNGLLNSYYITTKDSSSNSSKLQISDGTLEYYGASNGAYSYYADAYNIAPGTTYTITESNYDVTGYQRTTTYKVSKVTSTTVDGVVTSTTTPVTGPTDITSNPTVPSDYVTIAAATTTLVEITNSYTLPSGDIQFTKKNSASAVLAGATFGLYTDAACTTVYTGSGTTQITATSDASGIVKFEDLTPGTYYMKEITAPDGYILDTTIYTVVVTDGGTAVPYVTVDGSNVSYSEIVNYPTSAAISFEKKITGTDTTLEGAKFELYYKASADAEYSSSDKMTFENEDGTTTTYFTIGTKTISPLAPGYYKLVETEAPAGYYRMTSAIEFTVANGVVTFTNTSSDWKIDLSDTLLNGYKHYTITVYNHTGTELPNTGGPGTLTYTIGGLLLMAASLLYGIGQRRKRERGEEI